MYCVHGLQHVINQAVSLQLAYTAFNVATPQLDTIDQPNQPSRASEAMSKAGDCWNYSMLFKGKAKPTCHSKAIGGVETTCKSPLSGLQSGQ